MEWARPCKTLWEVVSPENLNLGNAASRQFKWVSDLKQTVSFLSFDHLIFFPLFLETEPRHRFWSPHSYAQHISCLILCVLFHSLLVCPWIILPFSFQKEIAILSSLLHRVAFMCPRIHFSLAYPALTLLLGSWKLSPQRPVKNSRRPWRVREII